MIKDIGRLRTNTRRITIGRSNTDAQASTQEPLGCSPFDATTDRVDERRREERPDRHGV